MDTLTTDIAQKITELFVHDGERELVTQLMLNIWKANLNVGADQLARSILILSDSCVEAVQKMTSDFNGDPRDVIMQAEMKMGNPGHYFIHSF